MFCEQCGTQNDVNSEYCMNCGHKLRSSDRKAYSDNGYSPYTQNHQEPSRPSGNDNSNTTLLLVMCVVVTLLVVGIIAGVVSLIVMNDKDDNKRTEIEVVEVTATPVASEPTAQEPVVEEPVAQEPVDNSALEDEQELPPQQQEPDQPAPIHVAGFIIGDSETRVISESELWGLSQWELLIARNEIYARHGRIFDRDDLASYFAEQSWYVPSIPASQFNDGVYLNKTELKNAKTISQYEESLGY